MGKTINYGLYIEDDSSVLFKDWRNRINGPADSAMVKIDALLKELSETGIADIATEESNVSGGENKITFTLANGDIIDFTVRNGTDGIAGIYIGDGDMPDDCKLQILPSSGNTSAPTVGNGGYYIPSVSQVDANTIKISFSANLDGMNTVPDLEITLPAGNDGYTPQKGIDYWTETDKDEIKTYVDNLILGGEW